MLLKAAINRIAARITEKLINSAQEFTEIAEELPQKLQNEWHSFKEEVIVTNRFSNEPALLPWFAVAVYDTIIGAEQAEDYDTMRKGITWFQKYFTDQYYTLLD